MSGMFLFGVNQQFSFPYSSSKVSQICQPTPAKTFGKTGVPKKNNRQPPGLGAWHGAEKIIQTAKRRRSEFPPAGTGTCFAIP